MPIQLVVYYDIDNVLDAEVRLTGLYLPKSFFQKRMPYLPASSVL